MLLNRSFTALAAFGLSLAVVTPARADDEERSAAKEAYDRGLKAHDRGDVRLAAEEFARADALAPSAVALGAALDAAVEADDVALGSELLERSKREVAPPPDLSSTIAAAHAKFDDRAGRIRIRCPRSASCLAKIDDRAVDVDRPLWAAAGQHTVIVQVDGDARTRLVALAPGQLVEITSDRSETPATASSTEAPATEGGAREAGTPATPARKLPRAVFYTGAVLTMVAAGATTYFALETSAKERSFERAGCVRANFPDCAGIKANGEDSQTAANVGFAVTGALAIGTAVLGLWFTEWKGQGPVLTAYPGGGELGWRRTF